MTSRERITNALEGKPVDHLPFSPNLAYVWESFPAEVQEMGQPAFLKEIGADPMWRGAPCPVYQHTPDVEIKTYTENDLQVTELITPVGSLRQAHKAANISIGNTLFLVEHPLKTPEDFKVQLWIEENARVELGDQGPVNESLALDGLSVGMLIPRGKTAFQLMIEHHVGTEELIYALCDYPEEVEALWEAMVANDVKAVKLAAESGYDYFITWEDSSTQNYSPSMYDKFIASEIKQFCDILSTNGKSYMQHACGHLRDILPSMKSSGIKAVESIVHAPTGNIPLEDARQILGSEVGIIGGIEPTVFLNLPIDELEPYVHQVIRECSGGPFVLANSDSCPPGVTVEKFRLVCEIVKSYAF